MLGAGCRGPNEERSAGAADAGRERREVHRSHRAMGTQITLTAYTEDEALAVASFSDAFAEFDRLDRMLSVWHPESDVSRVNRAAGLHPVEVSEETFEVVRRSIELSRATDGKFDVTFGALSGLWKFDHDQDDRVPPPAAIARLLPYVDYQRVALDGARRTLFLEREGMRMHLGGIGKGYAVDRAVTILRARGLRDFMVQAGGDLFVSGTKGDRPWRVGIRDPRGPPSAYFAAAEITDATFSTSGDYERSFVQDGRRYHHILDPATGQPARGCRSVTVMARDATLGDGLSTGVFILGVKRGLEVVESFEGAAAVIVDDENRVHVSRRLEGKIKILAPPTGGI